MKSVWIVAAVVALGAGCQRGEPDRQGPGGKTQPMSAAGVRAMTPEYKGDIAALCEVSERSGAPDDDSRTLLIANWLAANLKTPDSRKFLVEIQPLVGNAKADALEAEAKRVGLDGCALAAEWRTPT